MPANQTKKNHYVPCFYTQQWTSEDGRLCQFSRPHRAVVPKRVHPDATGYSRDLYTEQALPAEFRAHLEDVFLKKVDQRACDALGLLLEKRLDDLSVEQKTAWVRFMMSMLQRSPGKISSLRKQWDEQYMTAGQNLEEIYLRERKVDDPPTLAEYLSQTPADVIARGRVNLLQTVMDLPNVGAHILNMHWAVFEFQSEKFTLLTSDRPIVMTNGLKAQSAHIGLPISPTQLFLCANSPDTFRALERENANDVLPRVNQIVASQTEQLVYGTSDKALRFVEKYLPKKT